VSRAEYAGFWLRFGAIIIDALLLAAAGFVLSFVSLFSLFGVAWFLTSLFSWAIGWLYFSLMESSKLQATLGKIAVGIIVTDTEGRRISFGRATGRYFAKIISAIMIYIGFLMIAFTEKKQGLHDMLANCLVIRK